jgi:hypothetical protein
MCHIFIRDVSNSYHVLYYLKTPQFYKEISESNVSYNEIGGACSSDEGGERRIQVLVGKPEGKKPLGIPRHRWEDNIQMDVQEVGCGVWTGLSWLRIETTSGHL